MSAYELARLAECGTPDSKVSPGAEMLMYVRDAIVEAWEKDELDERFINETVGDAPDTMTHLMWLQFVDLLAYQEEDVAPSVQLSMDDAARRALTQIADRLANRLRDELARLAEDEDEGITGVINDHRRDDGYRCTWSCRPATNVTPGDRCPLQCEASAIEIYTAE